MDEATVTKVARALWEELNVPKGRNWDDHAVSASRIYWSDRARVAITALAKPQLRDAPEGFVLVPKEPTEEMKKAASGHVWFYDSNIFDLSVDQDSEALLCWRAMLAAAPSPAPAVRQPKEDVGR